MKCFRCNSERVMSFGAKSSDMNNMEIGEHQHNGYVPDDIGIGGGDYVDFEYCLSCGQIQGEFPLAEAAIERGEQE